MFRLISFSAHGAGTRRLGVI